MHLFARSSHRMDGRRNRWDRREENVTERRIEQRLSSSQMLPESNGRQADLKRIYSVSFSLLSVRVLDTGRCENERVYILAAKEKNRRIRQWLIASLLREIGRNNCNQ